MVWSVRILYLLCRCGFEGSVGGRRAAAQGDVDKLCRCGYKEGVGDVMEYWSGIFGMSGAACIAITFIDGNLLPLFWGVALSCVGYRLWRSK